MAWTLLVSLLISVPTLAQSQTNCETSKTATELIRCALSQSSQIQTSRAFATQSAKQIDVAKQRINPELDIEIVPNGNGGQGSEIILLHTFELGGKRSARINSAKAESEIAQKQLLLAQEEITVQTVASLYRLRQIDSEIELLKETGETFSEITGTYRKRLKLAAQQEVSLSIFEIAAEETNLRLSQSRRERSFLEKQLEVNLGVANLPPNILPSFKSEWPEFKSSDTNAGGAYQMTVANKSKAQANIELAQAESWPNLALGPKLEVVSGNQNDTQIGIALSLPLPLFQANGAGRSAARLEAERIRLETDLTSKRLNLEKERLLALYQDARTSLKRSAQNAKMKTRHRDLHRLLQNGLIDASLVIELHRQLFEYQTTLHAQELSGVEALWKLYAFEGRLFEGEVK